MIDFEKVKKLIVSPLFDDVYLGCNLLEHFPDDKIKSLDRLELRYDEHIRIYFDDYSLWVSGGLKCIYPWNDSNRPEGGILIDYRINKDKL